MVYEKQSELEKKGRMRMVAVAMPVAMAVAMASGSQIQKPLTRRLCMHSPPPIHVKPSAFMFVAHARNSNSNSAIPIPETNELSVFRFTLGIAGFDESYLPRIIGIAFGFLLLLNHVFTLTQTSVTAAQLRSEFAGLFLAAIATSLPYVGKQLKGMSVARQQNLRADCREVFLISEYLSDVDKEDLAWGSYAVLRNTVSSSLLIYCSELLCARGCWDIPAEASKDDIVTLLGCEIDQLGLSHVTTTLYLQNNADRQGWEIVPKGTASLLVQPLNWRVSSNESIMHFGGFMLLASSIPQAYGDKERAWVAAIANKFKNIQCTIKE